MDADQVREVLKTIGAPDGRDIVSAGIVSEVEIEGEETFVVLAFDGVDRKLRHSIEDQVRNLLGHTDEIGRAHV